VPRSKRRSGGKRSRFDLSSKGELALATVGVFVIGLVLFLIWAVVSPRIVPVDKERAAKESELARQYAARWDALQKGAVVLKGVEERQDVYVDPQKWNALLPPEQTFASAAVCRHYKWKRCFVFDGSGQRLGWYTEADGYQRVKPGEREK